MNFDELPRDLARSRIIRSTDAAAYLGLDPQMFRRLRREGKLPPAVKFSERVEGYRLGDLADLSARMIEERV